MKAGKAVIRGVCAFAWLAALSAHAAEADAPTIPNPLSLQQALGMLDEAHPELAIAAARVQVARAELTQAESITNLRAHLEFTPQRSLPTTAENHQSIDDSRARFVLQQRLYDFGRSRALETSARSREDARASAYLDERQRRHIEIMSSFFEALQADMRYAVDNEALAYDFIQYDRGRDRHAQGRVSDIDLLELETRFQDSRTRRAATQAQQHGARLRLALALNRPNELPGELQRPDFSSHAARKILEFRELFELIKESNPMLSGLRKEAEAARSDVEAEQARRRPVLSAEIEAANYRRELQSRDDLRASLTLRVPIYQGREDSAAIALAKARLHDFQARLAKAEADLRQTALALTQDLEVAKVQIQAAAVRTRYRDLYVDRSRALYELEVRTDLGDAQTRQTEAQWLEAQAQFRAMLAWAKIEALTGQLLALHAQEKRP